MFRPFCAFFQVLILIVIFAACDHPEFPESPYPRIETLPVANISETGVTLRGNITQEGLEPITDHGFVWGTTKEVSLNTADKVQLGTTTATGQFDATVNSGLNKGQKYYAKAFVSTASYVVYGKAVTFTSQGSEAPVIESFSPSEGTWGDTITITGHNFSALSSNNTVKFGTLKARVVASQENLIRCVVPDDIESLSVKISVEVAGGIWQTSDEFMLTVPIIDSFSPQQGTFLDEMVITGSNFGIQPADHAVTYGGHPAEVIEVSNTTIKVKVPTEVDLKENEIKVTYHLQSAVAAETFTMLGPSVTGISVTEGKIGDIVELTGENFNPRPQGNEIMFDENPATIISATGQSLIVQVPDGIYPERNCSVAVNVVEQSAQGGLFKLLNPWILKGRTPLAERNGGGFAIDGMGYLVAGEYLYRYDPSDNSWTRRADFPGDVRFSTLAFAAGGYGHYGMGTSGCCQNKYYRDLWQYSPASDSWSPRDDFPLEQGSTVGAGLADKGYVFLGAGTISTYEFDANAGSWQFAGTSEDLNPGYYPHQLHSAFTMDNRLFVFLKADDYATPQLGDFLYEVDPSTNTWTRRAEYDDERCVGFVINGTAYVKGFRFIHKYDLATNQLTFDVSPLAKGYFGMYFLFTIYDKAYFLGEWSAGQYEFWEFDPAYL